MPEEAGPLHHEARLADALVMLASAGLGADPDLDRSTVVVHVPLGVLAGGDGGSAIEGGGIIDGATARRLACSSRIQALVEDASGDVVRLGRIRRDPPAWMVRQLRHRDGGCMFPGCGSRRFTHAHHITWWERGGETELQNLVLLCGFHHKLVHEYGWTVRRGAGGGFRWFRPDGSTYRAGPGPPKADPIGNLFWDFFEDSPRDYRDGSESTFSAA